MVTTPLAIHAFGFVSSHPQHTTPVWSSLAWLLGPCKAPGDDAREPDSPLQLTMFEVTQ